MKKENFKGRKKGIIGMDVFRRYVLAVLRVCVLCVNVQIMDMWWSFLQSFNSQARSVSFDISKLLKFIISRSFEKTR